MAEPMEQNVEALPDPNPNCSIAKIIGYVGNGVILMEILLIVYMTVAMLLLVRGWLGVAMVLYLVPTFVMIVLLTNDLKNQFRRKYLCQ